MDGVDELGVLLPDVGSEGVAVAHNGVGHVPVIDEGLGSSITTHDVRSMFENALCYGVGWVVSCGENDCVEVICEDAQTGLVLLSFINLFHLKYPMIAMIT